MMGSTHYPLANNNRFRVNSTVCSNDQTSEQPPANRHLDKSFKFPDSISQQQSVPQKTMEDKTYGHEHSNYYFLLILH